MENLKSYTVEFETGSTVHVHEIISFAILMKNINTCCTFKCEYILYICAVIKIIACNICKNDTK